LVFFPCPLTPGFSKPDGANATVFDTDLGNASQTSLAHPPTADDICRTLEQAAAENALPVEFFARVIWLESRFNAKRSEPQGCLGIAQFMPRTADWHGLADPFDPIEALHHSALRELRARR
jgi:hypothetical protein